MYREILHKKSAFWPCRRRGGSSARAMISCKTTIYENTHEVHRSACPVIAKAEFRVEAPHKSELWSSCLPHVG